MFSLARRIWNSHLFSTFVLLPLRFLDRVLDMIRLFLGVQEGKISAERVIESNIPTTAKVSLYYSASHFSADRTVRCKAKIL